MDRSEVIQTSADRQLTLIRGDITRVPVDAIVNAANECMLGGGGVDGAIHRAAGPELYQACLAVPRVADQVRCRQGDARITPGFRLPARFVIHTVGPVYESADIATRARVVPANCRRTSSTKPCISGNFLRRVRVSRAGSRRHCPDDMPRLARICARRSIRAVR